MNIQRPIDQGLTTKSSICCGHDDMFSKWGKLIRKTFGIQSKKCWIPHGPDGIEMVGPRRYVGFHWHEIGRLQFNFLVNEGLRPEHYLMDVACGSLRAGIHLIPYLDTGHYLGIDKEATLIEHGIDNELGRILFDLKKPELVISDSFEFEKFSARPNFAIAQSLFTHLTPDTINVCFSKLRQVMADNGAFYATFFESESERQNPSESHDHLAWYFTRAQMDDFGERNGWVSEYIGDWNHPRNQVIVRYRVC